MTTTPETGAADRALLVLAAKYLDEHSAWRVRNLARTALARFRGSYHYETGEHFYRDAIVDDDTPEVLADLTTFDRLHEALTAAQRALTTKRAATRRAAAAIGEAGA